MENRNGMKTSFRDGQSMTNKLEKIKDGDPSICGFVRLLKVFGKLHYSHELILKPAGNIDTKIGLDLAGWMLDAAPVPDGGINAV